MLAIFQWEIKCCSFLRVFSPGLHVTAGDDSGKIWVYDVGEQLAMPQADEWNKFAYTLQV